MPVDTAHRVRLDEGLASAKAALNASDHRAAFAHLAACCGPRAAFTEQARVARVFAKLDPDALRLTPLRVALLAGSTLEHMAGVLRFWLATAGFAAEVYIAPFDTAVPSILDPGSGLHAFGPDVVWLFTTFRDLDLACAPGDPAEAVKARVEEAVAGRRRLWSVLVERLRCTVVQNNADGPPHEPWGNLAGAAVWGPRSVRRLYNVELAAAAPPGVVVFDLDHVTACLGTAAATDERYWFHSRHAFALDATGPLAHLFARLVAAARGRSRKCLVLDLDNTLWGGVVADDGLEGIALGGGADGEAFLAFQGFVQALQRRGVILAACSKNEPETASLPFRDHPDTVLRTEDFAVFRAGWGNKADAVREIARTLNIGLDSLVFVDDNPMERDIVRRHLPEVEVIELPDDPAFFVPALAGARCFESILFSAEDGRRGRYYADNARRADFRAGFVDMEAYLDGLAMAGRLGAADAVTLPRIAQLINKSNQFHPTGTRYAAAELEALADDRGCAVLGFRLRDRFGDNGLIAGVVLRRVGDALDIDTWAMSCRVLGRTMEEFIANAILDEARRRGCAALVGRYVPSAKNGLVKTLYERLGFALEAERPDASVWRLPVDPRTAWTTAVRRDDAA